MPCTAVCACAISKHDRVAEPAVHAVYWTLCMVRRHGRPYGVTIPPHLHPALPKLATGIPCSSLHTPTVLSQHYPITEYTDLAVVSEPDEGMVMLTCILWGKLNSKGDFLLGMSEHR